MACLKALAEYKYFAISCRRKTFLDAPSWQGSFDLCWPFWPQPPNVNWLGTCSFWRQGTACCTAVCPRGWSSHRRNGGTWESAPQTHEALDRAAVARSRILLQEHRGACSRPSPASRTRAWPMSWRPACEQAAYLPFVVNYDVQVRACGQQACVPSRHADLRQRPPTSKGVADERVASVVDAERSQALAAQDSARRPNGMTRPRLRQLERPPSLVGRASQRRSSPGRGICCARSIDHVDSVSHGN